MKPLLIALVGITGVLLGMSIIANSRPGSAREWAGAVTMLASVLLIPVGAAIWALPG
ncbi:hypothetical protein SEA_DONNY_93 [Mycobacterium phage Donny]|uniref:Uncharacterized protein n=1 Tax=Mycobacterium phage Donny TaxID=2530126 RepID=A0A481VS62_9CAUD|nr:hypothetical protein SEA_DONNY_93 [Mycobacterium phage Donny]